MYRIYLSRYLGSLVSGSPDLMLCSVLCLSDSRLVPLINRAFYWHAEHCQACLHFDLGGTAIWAKSSPATSSNAVGKNGGK